MAAIRVTLLGGASLVSGRRRVDRLERKTAALLAYLALAGPTVRTRVAGLLWPESPEKAARNNLAQAVRRLREAASAAVVEGDATLALAPGVEVDVARLELLSQRGHYEEAARNRGALLDGHDYDDCEELDRWVASQRERTRRALRRACAAEAERLEREGRLEEALARTRADLDADPLDEEATRRRMRLLYRTGDTAEALRVYASFEQRLEADLGAVPHEETEALAEAIRDGVPMSRRASTLPSAPAPLVGRRAEWAALERAWKKRGGIVVVGAPGIGKTRLIQDFAATKGAVTKLGGRPNDVAVPYATCARVFKQLVADHAVALPGWVKAELARIVPSLGEPARAGSQELDKLRFFEAMVEAVRAAGTKGMTILCFDDLQFVDAASLDAFEHVFSTFWSEGSDGPRTLFSARSSMDAPLDARLRRAEDAGLITRIELEALGVDSVAALLASEGALAEHAAEVHAITAGNPFFVLEILAGVKSGELDASSSLSRGERAAELVAQRLEALSSGALRLARVAAIASASFELELAADVLEVPAIELAEPLAELAEARIFEGTRFSHDLLQEITIAQIPASVRELVHRRVAVFIVARKGEPARAAEHRLAAGDSREAAPLFVQAGERALILSRVFEAASFLERAADLFEALGERSRAFAAMAELRRFARELGSDERYAAVLARMATLATTDNERGRVAIARGFEAMSRGRSTEASRLADEAFSRRLDAYPTAEAHQLRVYIELARNDIEAAARHNAMFDEAAKRLDSLELGGSPIWHDAEILAEAERHEEAIVRYADVCAYLDRFMPQHWARARFLAFASRSHLVLGRPREARAMFAEARAHMPRFQGAGRTTRELAMLEAELDLATGDLSRVVPAARIVLGERDPAHRAIVRTTLALLQHGAGRAADAERSLADAAEEAHDLPHAHVAVLVGRAAITGRLAPTEAAILERHGLPLDRARSKARLASEDPVEHLAACEAARAEVERLAVRGYLAEAIARVAMAKSALSDGAAASAAAAEALATAESHPPVGLALGVFYSMLASIIVSAAELRDAWVARARAALD